MSDCPHGNLAPPRGPPLRPHVARDAARLLDLNLSRRMVYLGGRGDLLTALLDEWPQLAGDWLGPAEGQDEAARCLPVTGHEARMRYVVGNTLNDLPAADLVVARALDTEAASTLELLCSASPTWSSARARWLVLQHDAPHLSSVVGVPLLQHHGMRLLSQWLLSDSVRLLVCAVAHRIEPMRVSVPVFSPTAAVRS